jgi:hypothetical protein
MGRGMLFMVKKTAATTTGRMWSRSTNILSTGIDNHPGLHLVNGTLTVTPARFSVWRPRFLVLLVSASLHPATHTRATLHKTQKQHKTTKNSRKQQMRTKTANNGTKPIAELVCGKEMEKHSRKQQKQRITRGKTIAGLMCKCGMEMGR